MAHHGRRLVGVVLLAAVLILCHGAASLMPYAKDVTEPQLVGAQVAFQLVPALILWLIAMILLCIDQQSGLITPSRRWIALGAVPWVYVVIAALPTLINVCQGPGGVCG
jgi:hypothetical protein